MSAGASFVLWLVLTLALLSAAVWAGFAHRRRTHLALVVGALVGLGVTIYFAEQLGRLYDLESAGAITPIHLFLAKLTTLAYLLPIATGIRLWFRPAGRSLHRVLAFTVLGLTLVTAVTGTLMILMSEPKPPPQTRQPPASEAGAELPGRVGGPR